MVRTLVSPASVNGGRYGSAIFRLDAADVDRRAGMAAYWVMSSNPVAAAACCRRLAVISVMVSDAAVESVRDLRRRVGFFAMGTPSVSTTKLLAVIADKLPRRAGPRSSVMGVPQLSNVTYYFDGPATPRRFRCRSPSRGPRRRKPTSRPAGFVAGQLGRRLVVMRCRGPPRS